MDPLALILSLPAICLLSFLALPSRWANARTVRVRRVVTWLAGLQFVLAAVAALTHLWLGHGAHAITVMQWSSEPSLNPSIYYDGASSLMLLLVSFVGWVICRFSVRYLDGDKQQGSYFRWTAATIGAVSMMAISGNLLMFAVAWVLTSFGLHHLLLHFPDRPAAQRAAWTKFVISRVGDVALVTALVLTYAKFKTLDFAQLFAALSSSDVDAVGSGIPIALIGWFLIAAAVLKSAQFPFHGWLPQTMETPTPVSALMHAGIVNAGGYLLIRMSPLVVHAPSALTTLAIIGAVTAVFGGVVMMTQASVKQALAYSTIAQMGFMMLQCGMGAFTAAMLHLLAHSLYKAHAFLNSGSVVSQSMATNGAKPIPNGPRSGWLGLLIVSAGTLAVLFSTSYLTGFNFASKPGAFVFTFTLSLALITWGWRMFSLGSPQTMVAGLIGVASLSVFYMAGYLAIAKVLGGSVPTATLPQTAFLVNGCIAVTFCVLLGLHSAVRRPQQAGWLQAFRVHAANGFYLDAFYRRLANALTS